MKRIAALLTLALMSWLPATASAQTDLTELPGYFPAEFLDLVPTGSMSVEINLQGAMLRMIGAFAGDEEPEFASLVAALDGIRVRSGEFEPGQADAIAAQVRAGQGWLDANGWLPMVRVRDEGEEIYVYSREQGGNLVGFTIMAIEEGEATAVNLIGNVNPDKLERLISGLDLGILDDIELGDLERFESGGDE